jgi:hypothetical protein
MAEGCKTSDCTVAITGKCLLENDPNTCPERIASDINIAALTEPLPKPESIPTFPPSLTMSLSDINALMGRRYCKLVGVLGAPDAGKTAALVCLYLLLAHSKIAGYQMRDSVTLLGLEQISRGARRWRAGDAPGKLTTHTALKDERTAGFLHFRLLRKATDEVADILFPDLPGEWSTALIEVNDKKRLDFLKAAECVWIIVDGVQVTTVATRQTVLHKLSVLLQRVKALAGANCPPISLVITRRDRGVVPEAAYATVVEEAQAQDITLKVYQIASFSENDAIEPGTGLTELIESLFSESQAGPEAWPLAERRDAARQMLRYRASE